MKPKKYDYEKLYQKWYKVVWPNLCFYVLVVGALAGGVISFIIEDDIVLSLCILTSGIIAGFLSRFFSAVAISQKVTATDALLALRDGNEKVDVDDMPEL